LDREENLNMAVEKEERGQPLLDSEPVQPVDQTLQAPADAGESLTGETKLEEIEQVELDSSQVATPEQDDLLEIYRQEQNIRGRLYSVRNWPGNRLKLRLTLEGSLYLLIIGLAIFTRLWDLDVKALHHDEGVHAFYSWRYYDGGGYLQEPWKHGPFLYHITALSFWLFGPNEFTARLPAALFGIMTCLLPLMLRRELGRWGALTASFLLAISPTFMYFSRFIREDIFMAFATLAAFASLVRFVRAPSQRWWYILMAATGLLYLTKESYFFYTALFVGFLFLWLCWQLAPRLVLIFGAYLLVAVFAFFFVAGVYTPPAIPFENYSGPAVTQYVSQLVSHPIFWTTIILLVVGLALGWFAFREVAVSRRDFLVETGRVEPDTSAGSALFLPYERGSVAYAVGWLGRHWKTVGLGLFLLFAIYSVFYTGFFSNPLEGEAGLVAGLWYWMAQQGVARGAQPWYYYFLLLPLYEPLALLFGTFGGIFAVYKFVQYSLRRPVRRVLVPVEVSANTGAADASRQRYANDDEELDELEPLAEEPKPEEPSQPAQQWIEKTIPVHPPGNNLWPGRLRREEHPYFAPLFLTAWAFGTLGFYTWASEKMPWLTIQVALPFILLAAYFFQPIWQGLERFLGSRASRKFVLFNIRGRAAFWAIVAGMAITFGIAYMIGLYLSASSLRLSVNPYPFNWILIWVPPLLVLILWGLGGILVGSRVSGLALAAVAFFMLSFFLVKTAFAYSFYSPDIPVEMGIYTQTAPDLKRTVQQIQLTTDMTPEQNRTPILYDDEMRTPLDFYMRDYTNVKKTADFSPNGLQNAGINNLNDYPLILVSDSNAGGLDDGQKRLLSTGYVSFHRVFRWWFPEEPYRNFDTTAQAQIDFLLNKASKVAVADSSGRAFIAVGEVMTQEKLNQARDQKGVLDKLYNGNGGSALLLNVTQDIKSAANLSNPADFSRLWRFVFFREQVQPLGQLDFTLYVRNDYAGLFRQYGDLVPYPISQP
jgi:predicted membrane-bound mannosyltransferase